MPRSRNVVRRTLKDGTVKTYIYEGPKKRRGLPVGSIGWAIKRYLASPEFDRLAPGTKKLYRRGFRHLEEPKIVRHMVADFRRPHILAIRDKLAKKPGAANGFLQAASVLFTWCIDREIRTDFNPCARIPRLSLRERQPWPDGDIAIAMAQMQGIPRLAFLLGLHTGQREGDILALRWSDYDGEAITLVQQKTAEALWIPVPELAAVLDAAKAQANGLTIIAHADGRPVSVPSFDNLWNREMKRLGLTGLFHELRHTKATHLAERGATEWEIGAITGQKSLATLQRYTKRARQKKLALAATKKAGEVVQIRSAKRAKNDD